MKKLNKFFAVLVALAMMATLCVMSAFAADSLPTEKTQTDPLLVKELVVAEGVSVPKVTNTFKYSYDEENSKVTLPEGVTAPTISNQEIVITSDDSKTLVATDGESRVDHVAAKKPTGFTVPGVYAYTVEELSSVFDNGTNKDGNKEIIKDTNKYTIRYYVKYVEVPAPTEENPDATTTELQITDITVEDDGEKKDTTITDPTGTKDDNDTPEDTSDDKIVDNDGGFSFINTLKVTDGQEPQDPDHPTPTEVENFALKLTKTVSNAAEDENTKFPFSFKLTKAVGETKDSVDAYIYQKKADGTYEIVGQKIAFEYGKNNTVELKHNQMLAFPTLLAGTRYSGSENMANGAQFSAYTPSYAVTTQDPAATGKTTGSANTAASLELQGADAAKTYLLTENAKDVAAYTNDYNKDIDTPTGILISNLPYIALALVAIGGLVAYVVVRRRQDDEA